MSFVTRRSLRLLTHSARSPASRQQAHRHVMRPGSHGRGRRERAAGGSRSGRRHLERRRSRRCLRMRRQCWPRSTRPVLSPARRRLRRKYPMWTPGECPPKSTGAGWPGAPSPACVECYRTSGLMRGLTNRDMTRLTTLGDIADSASTERTRSSSGTFSSVSRRFASTASSSRSRTAKRCSMASARELMTALTAWSKPRTNRSNEPMRSLKPSAPSAFDAS
jgi:hypothetical protein